MLHPLGHCNPKWVLEGDICGCFNNISHEWLIPTPPTAATCCALPADETKAFEVRTDEGNMKNNFPELLNSK